MRELSVSKCSKVGSVVTWAFGLQPAQLLLVQGLLRCSASDEPELHGT
jgi:hypothetical protein